MTALSRRRKIEKVIKRQHAAASEQRTPTEQPATPTQLHSQPEQQQKQHAPRLARGRVPVPLVALDRLT